MSNVRDIGRKIQSLKNMQKVTRAMNMISSIKLKKYLAMQKAADSFLEATDSICKQIVSNLRTSNHSAVHGYSTINKVHSIVFSADKGLCGTHNNSVLKSADKFIHTMKRKGITVECTCLGIKAMNHARREEWEVSRTEEMNERTITAEVLHSIADEIYEKFNKGDIQQVWIFGNIFKSTLHQDTEQKPVLPLSMHIDKDELKKLQTNAPMETEPQGEHLAGIYSRIYLNDILRGFLIHSFLSEHSSRLTAMENATNNSDDLIKKYKTMQNHARQAAITNELIEIVSGTETL